MTDWKALAAEEADRLLEQALGRPVPTPTRPSKTGELANPAPRALGLDGEQLLRVLPSHRHLLSEISVEHGFFNFHFSTAWYTALLQEGWDAAPHWSAVVPCPQPCPATLSPQDVRLLTALQGKSPHWTLAARQDRENPAWLVRYTAARLAALEGRQPARESWTPAERALLRRCGDYPALQARPKLLAHWLVDLSRQVWAATPRLLSAPVGRCLRLALEAGLAAFLP